MMPATAIAAARICYMVTRYERYAIAILPRHATPPLPIHATAAADYGH